MIDTDKLRGVIAERRLSQKQVALLLKMTPNTFYAKMQKGVFDSKEMSDLIRVLNISNPLEIFFAEVVAQKATNSAEI